MYFAFLKSHVLRKCIESVLFRMRRECSLFKGKGKPLNSPVGKYRLCLTRVLKLGSLAESFWLNLFGKKSSNAVFLKGRGMDSILKVLFRHISLGMRQT